MSYRTIAVQVNASRHAIDRYTFAAKIANDMKACLVGVASASILPSLYLAGMAGEGAEIIAAYHDFARERALANLATFEAVATQAGVSSIEKREIDEEAATALCLQSRYSDLLIVSQNDPDEVPNEDRGDLMDYVVMHSVKPVLFVPYAENFHTVTGRMLIAWDGSLEASRAVTGALPFLHQAKLVEVVVFDPRIGPDAHGEEPGADIALYLARHGVNVDVSVQYTGNRIDIGNAILSHASDTNANLIIMGGYGHAHLREVMLGGATRTVLRSMTVPVLVSH